MEGEQGEGGVVSVYTTERAGGAAAAPRTPRPSLYQQIADSIVERLTSPIRQLFGWTSAPRAVHPHPARPARPAARLQLELQEPPELTTVAAGPEGGARVEVGGRDVEPLSPAPHARGRKERARPEKLTLYSSYDAISGAGGGGGVAVPRIATAPPTSPALYDDIFDFEQFAAEEEVEEDGVGSRVGGGSPLVYLLELAGSAATLAWGALQALLNPPAPVTVTTTAPAP